MTGMADTNLQTRWFRLTPDRVVIVLLAVECVLWLAERLPWPGLFYGHKGWPVLIALAVVGATILLMLLWFVVALLFRWRFQFGIRSLLVLAVVIAIASSWLAVRLRQIRQERRAVAAIETLNAILVRSEGFGPSWLRSLLGDDFCGASVESVDLCGYQVVDTDLNTLTDFTQIKSLSLRCCVRVTDAGVENIAVLNQLESLSLAATRLSDAGLSHLKGFRHLKRLELDITRVTDAGLEQLTELNDLEYLGLTNTRATDKGVKRLQAALPNCKIEWGGDSP